MRIETVAVFNMYDLDHEDKKLIGFGVALLNAVDRIEVCGVTIDKSLFSQKNWFDKLVKLITE